MRPPSLAAAMRASFGTMSTVRQRTSGPESRASLGKSGIIGRKYKTPHESQVGPGSILANSNICLALSGLVTLSDWLSNEKSLKAFSKNVKGNVEKDNMQRAKANRWMNRPAATTSET